ncbi:hypothetical protein, partial [Akkermansia sp.]|uniref:hypothetical protein n=1 Tax=Akkermansia sp. TaxID=1872421 RepID=UPI003AB3D1A8
MSFYIGIAKLHADIPHETLTFLEDSKNALSPRMFNTFEGLRLFDIRRQIDPVTNQPVIAGLFGPNGS